MFLKKNESTYKITHLCGIELLHKINLLEVQSMRMVMNTTLPNFKQYAVRYETLISTRETSY
jgi:hypothetical protein